ncbi:asparagine synthase (glutamine-hydrolyzing) [Nocardiopsis sp. NPDC050513]|uniref:asparagine synthase (glutamine-hydrolyzing) n=1 Tax=Nocardiopsis sp. NPDC050513 TaxID=3364338 RepID=UPI0037AACBD9
MSAIAGWVDHGRDLRREWSVIRAMTATMACRGPGHEAVWHSERALLGQRGVPGADAGEGPPLAVERDGRTAAVAVLDGEVYNADELAGELAGRGHRLTGGGHTEIVAAAYLEWGAGCAERLRGIYAFAVWDVLRGELLLVRDRLGNKPLFYLPGGHGALFASERKALLAHPGTESAVDLDGLREILSYAGTPGHGIFRGMRQVRPGHLVRVGADGVREERYWSLEAVPHTDDHDTTVATVRALLDDAVGEQTGGPSPVGMMLSGGLDSSGVTALAARRLADRGAGPLRTFSVAFGSEEDFQADEVWSTPDAPFVREMVARVGAEHTDIVVDTADLLDPLVQRNALRAKDVPSPLGNMNTSLYVLCRAVRGHTDLALLGDAADGVFGGVMWLEHEQLLRAPTFPWIAMARWTGAKHGLGTDLLAPDLLESLDMDGYCAERYRETMARAPHRPDESEVERRMRDAWYVNVTNWLETLVPHSESIAQSVGLSLRLPYCDHRLVEYVYNAPWSVKSFDGREKSLLRAALADVLPASVLERRKSPYPVVQDAVYAEELCGRLRRILDDPGAPVADLVDRDATAKVAAEPGALVSGRGVWVARTHAEMVIQLNTWLEVYGVRLRL